MATSYDIRFWAIRGYRGTRTRSYQVRWVVSGRTFSRGFRTRALAESFLAELKVAAGRGEAFDTGEGLPVGLLRSVRDLNWYDFACKYVDGKWPDAAATSRKNIAEGLTATTTALLDGKSGTPEGKELRRALMMWAFNAKTRATAPPEVRQILDWARRNSPTISTLLEVDTLRRVMRALSVTLDGRPASPNYFNRRRAVLHSALEYAVESKVLDHNPLKSVDGSWVAAKKTRTAVDRRCVVNPTQAKALLDAVDQPQLKAFFGCLYYAALRPEEAAHLKTSNLELSESGWGWIHLDGAGPEVGGAWTNSGHRRDQRRQLKHRGIGDGRTTPCPPQLTELLHWHLRKFGTDSAGRLFRAVRRPGPVAATTYCKVWARARRAVLTEAQQASPLARWPYDLRHAAVSTWLNGGVDPTQVAEWAGHSKKVLLDVYAKCLDGRQEIAQQRISEILGEVREKTHDHNQSNFEQLTAGIATILGSSGAREMTPERLARVLAEALPGLLAPPP